MSEAVYNSVFLCNQLHGHKVKGRGEACPKCGQDKWTCFWGVNPEYRSTYNPGEYIQFTCAECGHIGEELPS